MTNMLDVDRIRATYLAFVAARFRSHKRLEFSEAVLFCVSGNPIFMPMDEADGDVQRRMIQQLILKELARPAEDQPFIVFHAAEVWYHPRPLPARGEKVKSIYEKDIDQLPTRKEAVHVMEEARATPVRSWRAEITRDAKKVTLSDWIETSLVLPRPTWKRYWPSSAASQTGSVPHSQ